MDHVEKFYWIINHPAFCKEGNQATIELCPAKVNPDTCSIDENSELNTKYEWWVELAYEGKTDKDLVESLGEFCMVHDYDLDCEGDTAEDAVDNLYNNVIVKYGDY